jgi:hypothetical protein
MNGGRTNQSSKNRALRRRCIFRDGKMIQPLFWRKPWEKHPPRGDLFAHAKEIQPAGLWGSVLPQARRRRTMIICRQSRITYSLQSAGHARITFRDRPKLMPMENYQVQ